MPSINALGLKVAVVTAIVVLAIFGIYWGIKSLVTSKESSSNQVITASLTPSPAPILDDTDKDGLPDIAENVYKSSTLLPDTDGDGTNDGDEVLQKRNPTVAGPDDRLPTDDTGNVKLPSGNTFTDKYIAQLPPDADQSYVLQKERLEAFVVEQQAIIAKEATPVEVTINSSSGKEAVRLYLEAISSAHNDKILAVSSADIEAAFRLHYVNNQSSELERVIKTLEGNLTALQAATTPQETADLHKRLISASQSLLDSTLLLKTMSTDFMGGLIGAKTIEDLGDTFNQISSEITALEKKYGFN